MLLCFSDSVNLLSTDNNPFLELIKKHLVSFAVNSSISMKEILYFAGVCWIINN